MVYFAVRLIASIVLAIGLAACGGSGSGVDIGSESPVQAFDQKQVAGYWEPVNPANDGFEFYPSPISPPFAGDSLVGRIVRNGQLADNFFWLVEADGSIKVNVFDSACDQRPVNLCPVTSVINLSMNRGDSSSATWTAKYIAAGGIAARTVTDTYNRKTVDLSVLGQGEHFLNHAEYFNQPLLAKVAGGRIGIRLTDITETLTVSANMPAGAQRTVEFEGGEQRAVNATQEFMLQGGTKRALPVTVWSDHFVASGLANQRFMLQYELHKKVQLPSGLNPSMVSMPGYQSTDKADIYESVEKRTAVVGHIDGFMRTTYRVRPGDRIATYMMMDFSTDWGTSGANDIQFTSETEGIAGHTDLHFGTYSESHKFTWKQAEDGTITMQFPTMGEVSVRFVKAINGGYQALYSYPDRRFGIDYWLHDWIVDEAPVVTASTLPGKYVFTSSDGVAQIPLTFHKDGTVTGAVEGYWFQDTNGDIVSFECADLINKQFTNYDACFASFNDLSRVSFAHIRRLKFMHKNGNDYQVKYDADVYGQRFFVVNRDYYTVAWTYRWTRVGDE